VDLCGDAMFVVNGRERLVEFLAECLGHYSRITHRHFEALMAEHAADGLNLHPVLPPLNSKRMPELMARGSRHSSNTANPGDQVIERVNPWAATSPSEEEVPHLLGAFIANEWLWPAAPHPGIKRFDQ